MGVQPVPAFMEKAHQLYEMTLVRHGLMLVGYSYGAKTSIYRCGGPAGGAAGASQGQQPLPHWSWHR
jgi:hypothetical protein